jgi:hypothetical protein
MPDMLLDQLLQLFEKNFSLRAGVIRKYWDYYDGDQTQYLSKFTGETDTDHAKRLRGAVYENQCAPTIDIPAARIYGTEDGEDSVSRRATDEEANKVLHENVYDFNYMPSIMIGHGVQANIAGTSVIHLVPWDVETNRAFDLRMAVPLRRAKGTIRYQVLDSETTIPIVRIGDEPELGAIVRRYVQSNATGDTMIDRMIQKATGEVVDFEIIEYVDDNHWIKWKRPVGADDNLWELDTPILPVAKKAEALTIDDFANPYGSVNIPFVVLKNMGRPYDIEGVSDLKNLIPLQDDINESMNDDRNVLRFHSCPIPKFTTMLPGMVTWRSRESARNQTGSR